VSPDGVKAKRLGKRNSPSPGPPVLKLKREFRLAS
jgi:hypothetical protein